jgi:hypothetical protein
MTPRRARLAALAVLLPIAGCGDAGPDPDSAETAVVPYAPARSMSAPLPLAGDFPELSSGDCVEVVRFYVDAIGAHEYDKAALVWNDPEIDAARLRALFADYKEPLFEWTEPFVEGGGGVLRCAVGGTLIDARDRARPVVQGTLELRRAEAAPGATPVEQRWTLRSSTFLEALRHSEGG